MTTSVWRTASFWTMIVGILVQLGVGIGYQLEAEMIASIAATVIAYLVHQGVVQKAEIAAISNYNMGYRDGIFEGARIADEDDDK